MGESRPRGPATPPTSTARIFVPRAIAGKTTTAAGRATAQNIIVPLSRTVSVRIAFIFSFGLMSTNSVWIQSLLSRSRWQAVFQIFFKREITSTFSRARQGTRRPASDLNRPYAFFAVREDDQSAEIDNRFRLTRTYPDGSGTSGTRSPHPGIDSRSWICSEGPV